MDNTRSGAVSVLSASLAFLAHPGFAQVPTLNLPATVQGVQVVTTGPSTSTLTISGVPDGLFLKNATYHSWCANPAGYVPGEIQNPDMSLFDPSGIATYAVYSSYDANLPNDGKIGIPGPVYGGTQVLTVPQEWQIVNYVLNYPSGKNGKINASVNDIQAVIWQLLRPTDGIAYLIADITDANALALYEDALANGLGFVPVPGQLIVIVFDSKTPVKSPKPYQAVLCPVPLPGGHIVITKCANLSKAGCFELVTYKYVVTNTGPVTLSGITVIDDNGTPNYAADDEVVGSIATLAPGQSVTFTRELYLPIRQYAVDSRGNPNWSYLIPQRQANGDMKITFLQDEDLIDTTYGLKCSGGWQRQGGNTLSQSLGANYAEFSFTDGRGNTVLDFQADYLSANSRAPSGLASAGIHHAPNGLLRGDSSGIASISTSLSDNLNLFAKFNHSIDNSPVDDHDWQTQSAYTVAVRAGAFGWFGFGGCAIKNVYNARCKTGGGGYCPKPVCDVVKNTATVSAVVALTGQKLTATATASVTLSAPCRQQCPPKNHRCAAQHT
jgi:hypothetical protein